MVFSSVRWVHPTTTIVTGCRSYVFRSKPLQYVGLILGGFLVLALGSPIGIILTLVALKTAAEVFACRRFGAKWSNPARGMQALVS